jgi:hypothetical protein
MNNNIIYLDQYSIKIKIDSIYLIYMSKSRTKFFLFINNELDDESISDDSLYHFIKLNSNDIITIKNEHNELIDLLNNDFFISCF